MTLGEMIIRVGADTKDFALGMGDVNRQLGAVEREVSRGVGNIEKVSGRLSSIGMGMTAAVTLPIVGLGAASLEAAAKMETASTAFKTMMGSVQAANKHLADLKAFALATPFQFTELVDASRRMQALGFAADDVVPKLRIIGNAVSALGLGAEGLNRVILALGQMKAKGTVQAEEMRQLAEAGIPAWDALAHKLGVTVPEAMKLVEKRMVDAKTGIEAVEQAMGRFAGGMEAQAKTLGGIWSNVKDAIGFALADIGQTLAPAAKDAMNNILLPGLELAKSLAHWFAQLPTPIQNTAIALAGLAAAAGPLLFILGQLGSSIGNIILGFNALKAVMLGMSPAIAATIGLYGSLAAAVGYLGMKIYDYRKAVGDQKDASDQLDASLSRLVVTLRQQGVTAVNELKQAYDHGDISLQQFQLGLQKLAIEHGKTVEKTTEHKKTIESTVPVVETLKLRYDDLRATLAKIKEAETFKAMEAEVMSVIGAADRLNMLLIQGQGKLSEMIPEPLRDLTRPEAAARPAEEVLRTPTNLPDLRIEDQILINIEDHAEEIVKTQERLGAVIHTKSKPAMTEFGRQISTIFTDAGARIADLIVKGGSLKDIFVGVAQQIETAFLRMVIENAIKQAIKWIGKLMDSLSSLGGVLGKIFGTIGGSISSGAGSAAGGVISAGAGAAGSAAGTASSVGGSVMATIGAVASVGTMISGIIGNFQAGETNKTLDRIVLHTLQTANDLANLRRDDWERETHLMHKLDDMWRTILDFKDGMFHRMDAGGKLAGSNGVTVEINGGYFLSDRAMDDFTDAFVLRLKQRGVF